MFSFWCILFVSCRNGRRKRNRNITKNGAGDLSFVDMFDQISFTFSATFRFQKKVDSILSCSTTGGLSRSKLDFIFVLLQSLIRTADGDCKQKMIIHFWTSSEFINETTLSFDDVRDDGDLFFLRDDGELFFLFFSSFSSLPVGFLFIVRVRIIFLTFFILKGEYEKKKI